MDETANTIKNIEAQIEKALWEHEVHNQLAEALQVYQEAENKLDNLGIDPSHPAYAEQQRVLSYCLMRQGNILRQQGKPEQALAMGEREIVAARISGDEITLARSLMSNGTNILISGKVDQGLNIVDEALKLFEKGDSYDHKQGAGWYWIMQADLANAGLIKKQPREVLAFANHALDLLTPIQNWPGVARAYAACAIAHEKLGEMDLAAKDRVVQQLAESKIVQDDSLE
jgi:tetratricopeptide (TPR) repeat protein